MIVRTAFLRLSPILLEGLFVVPLLFSQADIPTDDVTQESLRFARVFEALEQNYGDPIDPDHAIFDGGIRGMLSTLDPFSAFLDHDQFELLQQQARGEGLGFGSILYVTSGKVVILQTAEGSPSWRAGLGPGDEIVSVNETRVDRLDFQSLVELLQRSRSHPVRLGVVRPGKVVAEDFELKPAEMALPTVDKAFKLSPQIGYLHLSAFEQKTAREITDVLRKLGGPELKALLLDLRDNHGGMVDAAVGVASLFLKPNLLVLTVRGRSVPEKTYRTAPPAAHFDFPLVVLVNGNTASAAEVLVAALEDHDRALIAGETTFGKGIVQSVTSLSEKTGLALTTAQYFTPSGRSIQRPLPGTALEFVSATGDPGSNKAPQNFRTANGRILTAGGGVTPDIVVPSRQLDPWVTFLNQRGLFTSFASNYLTVHGKVAESFEPDSRVLEEFRDFLAHQRIRRPEKYWKADQAYLKLRIKTELFNFVFGLVRGDEVEVRGDPQVREALALFPKIPLLLKPPVSAPIAGVVKRKSRPRLSSSNPLPIPKI